MTKTIETVRRTADVSREVALQGLIVKFPNHDIVSFKEERVVRASSDGNKSEERNWVAQIQKRAFNEAEFEGGGAPKEGPELSESAGPEDAPEDELADILEESDDEGDEKGESEKDLLHELLDLVHELVGDSADDGAPHGEDGPEGLPEAVPGADGPSDLPPPVTPHNTMETGLQQPSRGAFAHIAANRRTFFLEAEAPGQKLKEAVAELNAALAPTHRVARIKRKGSKIVAGVTKIPGA